MTDKNKLEDIFSLLDEITLDNNRQKTYQDDIPSQGGSNLANLSKRLNQNRIVKKPSLPQITNYTGRLDCFRKYIEGVDYGSSNADVYVEGHKDALVKYLNEIKENPNNLFIAEGMVNDEIAKYAKANKSSLYVKGYYDGLIYIYKALKSSKELIADKIYHQLKREIG